MIEIKAPSSFDEMSRPALFLSGSIEMGKAIDWQTQLVGELADCTGTLLNPRRDDWDSSWVQSKDNLQFRQQVEWELDAMEACDSVVFVFDPATKSPITLLELGLHVKEKTIAVVCPDGFWRKGNVDILCERENVPQPLDMASLASQIRFWTNI